MDTVKVIELTVVLTLSETEHCPAESVVQEVVVPLLQAPLTTAPDRAGLMVARTVAF